MKGFTIIEAIIVLAIIGLIGTIIVGVATTGVTGSSLSYGFNGMVETRCVEGYKYVVGAEGGARQMFDENGKGIKC